MSKFFNFPFPVHVVWYGLSLSLSVRVQTNKSQYITQCVHFYSLKEFNLIQCLFIIAITIRLHNANNSSNKKVEISTNITYV